MQKLNLAKLESVARDQGRQHLTVTNALCYVVFYILEIQRAYSYALPKAKLPGSLIVERFRVCSNQLMTKPV
jgi:hypothetical protein